MTTPRFDPQAIRERFSDAVDGTLDVAERRAFDDDLARDADLAAEYADFVEATRALRAAAPTQTPDDHVRAVLAAVASEAAAPSPSSPWPWGVVTHAASAVLGAAACLAVMLNVGGTDDVAEPARPTAAVVETPADVTSPVVVEATRVAEPTPAAPIAEKHAPELDPAPVAVETEPVAVAPAAPAAPLIALQVDGRRLASTWALVRDDVAALLDASLAEAAARAEASAPAPIEPIAAPLVEAPLVADAAPPADFEWPAELREVDEPTARTESVAPAPVVAAAASLAFVSPAPPPRDGVRLVAIDDQVSSLRTRGALVDVVPTLLSHLGADDDPATVLAAEQLDQIADRLARDPGLAPRLVTPRYAQPREETWLTSWFTGDDDDGAPTYDGTTASYWTAWYEANAALLAERLDGLEA